jgi:putative Holliday junction resolvase
MGFMALDIGERRIGIAISDSGVFATPHTVLYRRSKQEDFARIGRLVEELKIRRLIVGLPYSLDGAETIGPQAQRIKRYTEALAQVVKIPYEYVDESYSTVEAKAQVSRLRSAGFGKSSKQKKMPVDAVAAAVILQKYLDSRVSDPTEKKRGNG